MVLNNNQNIKLKKNKNLLAINKLKFQNKTKNILINSLALYFPALIKNSTSLYELNSKLIENFEVVNTLLYFLLAIRFNNKIYSKFCFLNFINSYGYIQSKKIIYKFLVLKLKSFSNKYIKKIK
jgi:hypothetical protein